MARCECVMCGQMFTGLGQFDKHLADMKKVAKAILAGRRTATPCAWLAAEQEVHEFEEDIDRRVVALEDTYATEEGALIRAVDGSPPDPVRDRATYDAGTGDLGTSGYLCCCGAGDRALVDLGLGRNQYGTWGSAEPMPDGVLERMRRKVAEAKACPRDKAAAASEEDEEWMD